MKMNSKLSAILLASGLLLLGACKKETTEENAEELITTLKVVLTEQGSGAITTFQFKDPDGDAGNPPTVFDEIILKPNKTYTCALEVLNESVSPAESLNAEIQAESNDHQFYFTASGANVTVSNLNNDSNGLPLGLTSTWTTGANSTGKIQIVLKHKPGVKASGDPVTKGDTDIELPSGGFTVKVQ